MWILPIMLFISWQLANITWAYVALGFAVTGTVVQVANKQAAQKAQKEALEAGVMNLFKGMQAKNN